MDEDESQYPEPQESLSESSESDAENVDKSKVTDMFKGKSFKPRKRTRRSYVAPKIAAFMEGVSGVSVVSDTAVIEEVQQKVRDLMDSSR